MLGRLCAFVTWLSHDQAYIRDINEKLVPLHPNAAQMLLLRSWMIQAARDVPIRTSILKARKLGASTFVQAFMYFCCKHYRNQRALTLAHVGEQTQEIFDITHRLGTNDPVGSPRQNRTMLFFSPSESRYSCHAAGGAGVAAGGTPNMLHRSELALWRPESQKIETDYTSGNAVPNTPTSMIIDESTARGRDLFFTRFKDAHKAEHPYEPVFLPWFLDSTLKAAGPDLWVQDDDEDRIVATGTLYGIVVSLRFKQEFPSTPEEAIEAQIGLVLPGLAACIIKELPFDYTAIDPATKLGGWDYGYNDPTAMVSAVYWDAALYVHDVHRARGELAEHSALNTMPGHRYYCDPSALGPRKEVAGHCGRLKIPATFVRMGSRGADEAARPALHPCGLCRPDYYRSGQLHVEPQDRRAGQDTNDG
jgi:hypothetical protein